MSHWLWKLWLVIFSVFADSTNYVVAQIVEDSTLGAESSTISTTDPLTDQIDGGAIRDKNLFHSFQEFDIGTGKKVYFSSPAGIENIITRVTGNSPSNIQGTLGVSGNANLFLLNSNGIIFGPNASLDLRGSFLASTATSINFEDGTKFSTISPQIPPLLKVSSPIGLQFGPYSASIINRSQFSPNGVRNSLDEPVGLQVEAGKTLALLGGDVLLENGNITATGGRIEIGSVVGSSTLVSLTSNNQSWTMGYEGIESFQNIQLSQESILDTNGESGGHIQIQGRDVLLKDASQILAETQGSGTEGEITLNTRKLILQGGSQISTGSTGFYLSEPPYIIPATGKGGNLIVNASESVEISGNSKRDEFSGLISATFGIGEAGSITIKTKRLTVQDGGRITSDSSDIIRPDQRTLATGKGGNLIVNASESVELTDGLSNLTGLFAATEGSGNAGSITLSTDNLVVRDKAQVAVSSLGIGNAGNIQIQARTLSLDNEGKLTATSELGTGGGDIILQDLNSLLLRGNSEISTNAQGKGNGGDITIATKLLTALGNSKITANASGTGNGGNIRIKTKGFFVSPNSEISAKSERGVDGVVEIDRLENDPQGALLTLPAEPVNISGLIAQGCSSGGGSIASNSKFVVTGRGGLPPTPKEAFRGDVALADLGKPIEIEATQAEAIAPTNQKPPESTLLVEAQGWIIGSKGEVILTASAPNVTPSVPWMKSNSCHGS